jgi:hypothetical protein
MSSKNWHQEIKFLMGPLILIGKEETLKTAFEKLIQKPKFAQFLDKANSKAMQQSRQQLCDFFDIHLAKPFANRCVIVTALGRNEFENNQAGASWLMNIIYLKEGYANYIDSKGKKQTVSDARLLTHELHHLGNPNLYRLNAIHYLLLMLEGKWLLDSVTRHEKIIGLLQETPDIEANLSFYKKVLNEVVEKEALREALPIMRDIEPALADEINYWKPKPVVSFLLNLTEPVKGKHVKQYKEGGGISYHHDPRQDTPLCEVVKTLHEVNALLLKVGLEAPDKLKAMGQGVGY